MTLILLMSLESRVFNAYYAWMSFGLATDKSLSHSLDIISASYTRYFTSYSSYSTFFFLGSIAIAY